MARFRAATGRGVVVLTVVVVVLGAFSAYEYTQSPGSKTTTLVTTQTPSSSILFPKNGIIEIDSGGNRAVYSSMKWNGSTPASFSLANVKFVLTINPAVTNTGSNCWVTGYGYFNVTFADGLKETLSPCTLPLASGMVLRLPAHTNPHAGVLIFVPSGDGYFLISS